MKVIETNLRNICLVFIALVSVSFISCEDDDDIILDKSEKAHLIVGLIDAPGDYQQVNIDIQDVQITPGGLDSGFISLPNVNAGIYDLLTLANGFEATLSDADIDTGYISQIRLILGDSNTVMVDSVLHELKVPSGSQSGLKVKIDTTFSAGITYHIVLDFDAAKSVVSAGNSGKYLLKPVIRTFVTANSGAIKGVVSPNEFSAVYAILNLDTFSTFTADSGDFLIQGVPPGTYDVLIQPNDSSSFMDTTINNVGVLLGLTTDLDTILLQ